MDQTYRHKCETNHTDTNNAIEPFKKIYPTESVFNIMNKPKIIKKDDSFAILVYMLFFKHDKISLLSSNEEKKFTFSSPLSCQDSARIFPTHNNFIFE